jgi:protoheme IX farnesyltransferase
LSSLVLMTTAVGYLLAPTANDAAIDWVRLLWTMLGTAMCAASANAFNQVIEIRLDAKMHRTMNRPLPGGHLRAPTSFVTAMLMGYIGIGMLAMLVNLSAAGLALSTILIYVLLYTPLKTRSTLNTLVGAVCGAIPPMIGWVPPPATSIPARGCSLRSSSSGKSPLPRARLVVSR